MNHSDAMPGEIEHPRPKCSCVWSAMPNVSTVTKIMTTRDPVCAIHGNETDWWARQERIARGLGARIHGE